MIFLFRNSLTENEKTGKFEDSTINSSLTDEGIQLAKDLSKELKNSVIDLVISSPTTADEETAKTLTNDLNLGDFKIDKRLIERDLGLLNGKRKLPTPLSTYYGDLFEDSESENSSFKRFNEVIQEISQLGNKNTLIISHPIVIGIWLKNHTGNGNIVLEEPLNNVLIDGETLEVIAVNYPPFILKQYMDR